MTFGFDPAEREAVAATLDAAVPGSVEWGAVEYVERLLGAFDHEPPRIWAAPGTWAGDGPAWLDPGPWERHAWRLRIDAWRSVYARIARGADDDADRRVAFEHACESSYGDPAYGGNREGAAWVAVGFPEPLFPPARSDP